MIYLDHAATTPLRREALDAMLPYLTDTFGNPSSTHAPGRAARAALDEAHEQVAAALHADPREIVFTSGGTEAINLAIKGAAWAAKARGHRIVTSAVEHHAVLHSVRHLEKFGFEIVELPVDRYGRVDPEQLSAEVTERTVVVSLLLANNEVGTVLSIADLVRIVRRHRGVIVHVDAVQAIRWLDVDVRALDVDLLSIAGHKIEGPKGTGALFVRRGTVLLSQQHGGAQERYRRAGTENVAGAVGLATALGLAVSERSAVVPAVRALRDRLRDAVLGVPGVELTGHPQERLPNHLSVVARDAEGASIAAALDLEGIACSTGSACASGSAETSHVLAAMGYPGDEGRGALRLTLGRTTTVQDVATASDAVHAAIARVRAVPLPEPGASLSAGVSSDGSRLPHGAADGSRDSA
jgi:cysteine desulfurase